VNLLDHNGKIVKREGFLPDDVNSRAIDFIEENKDNLLFLYILYYTALSSKQVPDKWWNNFEDKT